MILSTNILNIYIADPDLVNLLHDWPHNNSTAVVTLSGAVPPESGPRQISLDNEPNKIDGGLGYSTMAADSGKLYWVQVCPL